MAFFRKREDVKGLLRTVRGEPQTAGAADGVRDTQRQDAHQGGDRQRVYQGLLHGGLRKIPGTGGSQRHDAEDDGGGAVVTGRFSDRPSPNNSVRREPYFP